LTNSRVGMANFVDLHKVIAKSAFSTFPNAWNGGENKKLKNTKVKKKKLKINLILLHVNHTFFYIELLNSISSL
jgi:hypothetical protein